MNRIISFCIQLFLVSFLLNAKNITANFNFNIDSTDTSIVLINKSSNNCDSFIWHFGDTNKHVINNYNNVSHKYKAYGKYNVCLVAYKTTESDSVCKQIDIKEPLTIKAAFEATVNNFTVNLKNISSGIIKKTYWDFGDGKKSSKSKITEHTYSKKGTYIITLSVYNKSKKLFSTFTKTVIIGDGNNSAYFETDTVINHEVYFINKSIGNNLKWYWDFGDGKSSKQKDPSHLYANAGLYNVSLTLINEAGYTSSYTQKITIAGIAMQNNANFIIYPDLETDSITFVNKTSGNGNISYIWSFGNGVESTLENPIYIYPIAGNYNVCLTVLNNNIVADTKCNEVNAGESNLITPSFNIIPDSLKVNFVNTSYGDNNTYLWSFGDGTTSNLANPVHEYLNAQIFTVTLKINNGNLNNSTIAVLNLTNNPQKLVCRFVNEQIASGLKSTSKPVKFKGSISGDISKLRIYWDFGDGVTDSLNTEPLHYYTSEGKYTACYTVLNPLTSETDSYCSEIDLSAGNNIENNNTSTFSFYPNPCNNNLSFYLPNSTKGSCNIVISNTLGQKLKQYYFNENNTIQSVAINLPAGIYVVTYYSAQQTFSKNLIIQ